MSYNEWKSLKWGDIATLEYGKALRNYKDTKDGIPVFGTNGKIGFTDKSLCDTAGVIIGRKGAYRGVHYSNTPFFVIDTAYYLKSVADDIFDMRWAYYELLTKDINSMDSGSAIPSTSRNDFYALPVLLPALDEQKAIADTLACLDDKIELNNRINKTLEEMAQAIFKQWFVDFDFPDENGQPYKSSGGEMEESELGLIPKGWKASNVYDNVFERKVKNSTGRKLPVLSVVKEGKFVISEEYFSKQVYSKDTSKYKVIQKNEVGYNPSRANIGSIAMLKEFAEGLLSPIYVIFKISDRISPFYFDYYMKRPGFIEKIAHHSSGTTRQNFNFEALKDFDIVIPPMEMQEKAYSYIAIIEKTIKQLSNQNNVLSDIRDSLLPKLMSGEIRVPIEEVPTSV